MKTFQETGLREEILKAIDSLGFVNPTPIQDEAIEHLMNKNEDLIALAQTGTGKTAAFSLPLLHQLDINSSHVQSLILCPTRELCLQICRDIENYSKNIKGFNIVPVYGGTSIDTQIKALRKPCHFVVGTPGRTLDLMRRKKLSVSSIRWLVLDEADEMLSMGFKEEIDSILKETPSSKQTLLFSATMPREISIIADKYMNQRSVISVKTKEISSANISHAFYLASPRDRYPALKRIVDVHPNIYGIVFCRTRSETKEVAEKLLADGYNADALHGDLSQAQRDHIMTRFRNRQLQILVATDVAARGLDVQDLSHVINFSLPNDGEIYVHRSGRTGRAEKKGESLSIIHHRELGKIRILEKSIGKKITKRDIPSGKEICEKQLYKLIDKVEKINIEDIQIDEYLPAIYEKLQWLSREDLIKHFVSLEFNRFLSYYKNAKDLNVNEKNNDRNYKSYSRFFISLGNKDGLNPKKLLGFINRSLPDHTIDIRKIEILKAFSFFEVEEQYQSLVTKNFRKARFDGQKVSVELAQKRREKPRKFKRA